MDLDLLKQMAMADGVLTEHEKDVFRQYADLSEEEFEALFTEMERELESVQSETEVIDWKKKNGLDFEKYVVNMLNADYYAIENWTGDKYVNGLYDAKNLNPDVTIKVKLNCVDVRFAIECKWRCASHNNLIFVASDRQLKHYKGFQDATGIPVFIALGIGGLGESPESVYIIPIDRLKYNLSTIQYLQQFKKFGTSLFYDMKNNKLK